jgi:hypothetical protein
MSRQSTAEKAEDELELEDGLSTHARMQIQNQTVNKNTSLTALLRTPNAKRRQNVERRTPNAER